jgi:hypothetical protein
MLDAEGERVFESWVDAHTAILFKVVRVHGDADSDGEDPFQETRCSWLSVEGYYGDCAGSTWWWR